MSHVQKDVVYELLQTTREPETEENALLGCCSTGVLDYFGF